MDKKICIVCNNEKEISEFYKDKTCKFGVRSECKECSKLKKKKYYEQNQDKIKNRVNNWKSKIAKEASLPYWNIRANKLNERAKRYGLSEMVTGKEIEELYNKNKKCHYCSVSVSHNECHIDHYIPLNKDGSNKIENLTISCAYCNIHKSDKIVEDEKSFFEYIEKIYLELYPKYRN